MKIYKYFKALLYIFISIIILIGLIDTIYYFNNIKDSIYNILRLIIIFISVFIGGIYIGSKTNCKGYLEGIKLGIILVFIFLILNLLFFRDISMKTFIYYIGLIILSILGSMIGINKKKSN